MIQPTAPTPFSALTVIGDPPVLPAAEGSEGADFGALLAIQGALPSEAIATEVPLTGPGEIGGTAAAPGKILPHDLPDAAITAPPSDLPAALPLATASAPAVRPVKPLTKSEQEPKPTARIEAETATDQPAATRDAAADAVLPVLAALAAAAAAPPLAAAATSAPSAPPKRDEEPEHEHVSQGPLNRTIPTLPAIASALALAQMQRHAAQAPAAARAIAAVSAAVTEPTLAAAPPAQDVPLPAAAPAEQVRVELTLPRSAGMRVLNRDEARPLAKLPELALPDPASPLSATSAQPQPASAPLPAPVTQIRPHDFAALIERIAVAREASAPQAVSITVMHQDFGSVRLNFRSEDAGLSVAMSSADPGFVRAAAAIPAPVMPVASSEQTQLSPQQRGESGAAQTGSQAQSRGGSADHRRDGQPQPHHSRAQRGSRSGPAPRTGIFA